MIHNNSPTKSLRVLMMPDYRIDNPYQTLLSQALENQGVDVLFPFGYRRVFPIFRAIQTSKDKIDILHLHWLSPYLKGDNLIIKLIYAFKFLVDILLVKSSGIKIVWTIHNHVSHDSKFPVLERNVQKILFNLTDKIIFHTNSAVNEFSNIYKFKNTKAEVIPIGNYRKIYKELIDILTARQALGLPLSGYIYLNLGMLRPYKGIERLLNVWEKNQDFLQGNTLLIAGKALDDAYGQQLIDQANKIEGVIIHPQFIEDSEIHLFFSAADVVVLPFEKILTSASMILAMSYNKPVIAPRTGGIEETLGKADWLLYDPQDNQGLLNTLKNSTQVDLNKLSDIVECECTKLSWENIGIKTQKLYQSLILQ